MVELDEWPHYKFPNYMDRRPIFVQKVVEGGGFADLEETDLPTLGLPVEIVAAMRR
jgi:hypothetical protein